MPGSSLSNYSQQRLISRNTIDGSFVNGAFIRDASSVSAQDIKLPKLLDKNGQVEEQTLMQCEIVNENLLRKARRSELASKNACLTRRWQTALVTSLILLGLGVGIGGLAYWITLPKVITKPFLLYNEECYMNSRSCDADRMLWCPNGRCLCLGNFVWNATGQNCSCATYQIWDGFQCKDFGYYGDPCNNSPCRPTLTCLTVINQTYTTGQDVCVCDNQTYLDTNTGATYGTCVPRLTYNQICKTKFDCQNWLGLVCNNDSLGADARCRCSSSYWNGTYCVHNALGWEPCSATIPCDTSRGLNCSSLSNTCECDGYSYWDNVTTLWCQQKKTYAITCQYDFQCNTTVNLSCPSISTGCNCPATSYSGICDCQSGTFWDGQRCTSLHSFNGTCPGQYACNPTLVCHLGHCICQGNMIWNTTLPKGCECPLNTIWNVANSVCI